MNTHLEAAAAAPRNARPAELIAPAGRCVEGQAHDRGRDFNSDPQGDESDADP